MKQPQRGREVLYLTQQDVISVGLTRRDILELVRVAANRARPKALRMPAKIGVHPCEFRKLVENFDLPKLRQNVWKHQDV